jgi:nicotinate-nucleotide adenylyltransferase
LPFCVAKQCFGSYLTISVEINFEPVSRKIIAGSPDCCHLPAMKIGVYGGSFDPVHLGHLLVAQAAVEELNLDRIFFVPAAQSPFKPANTLEAGPVRLRLLRLALAGNSRAELDDEEIRRGGISYTVDTLRSFAARFPGAELFYLIGADNVAKLNEWREPDALARLAEFVVIPRPGEPPVNFPEPFRGRRLKGFPMGVSSSEIRRRLQAGLTVQHLMPDAVLGAIQAAGIYRS